MFNFLTRGQAVREDPQILGGPPTAAEFLLPQYTKYSVL